MAAIKDIAVIGCGPAGMSAALFLCRSGFNVTIYEQFDTAHEIGSGLMLQPTGMSVLHELGLLDEVLSRGKQVGRILGLDAQTGIKVLNVHYRHLGGRRFGLGIHRHSLFDVLFNAVKRENVHFEFGCEIIGMKSSSSGVHPVTSSRKLLTKHDLIIVASGSNSQIANSVFDLQPVPPLPFGAFWTTISWPASGFNSDMLEQRYRGAGKMAGLLPLGRGRGNKERAALFWSLKGCDVAHTKTRGVDSWKSEFLDIWPQSEPLLDQVKDFNDLTFADYRHYTLKRPYHGRTIFIGDAYHSTSPQLGQGANMALLDAKALAYAVKYSARMENIGPNYHNLRRWQVNIFQGLSRALTPFYQSDSWMLGQIRDLVVSKLVRIPPAPRLMAAMVSGFFVEPFKQVKPMKSPPLLLSEPEWDKFDR